MSYLPSVFIIIVNYNGWKDTIECLESLQNVTYPNYRVIVVDNNSTDNSLEYIKRWCIGNIKVSSNFIKYNPDNKPVFYIEYDSKTAKSGGTTEKEGHIAKIVPNRSLVLIKSEKNLGFSGGNNIAIRYSLNRNADYVLLLNNDTVVTCDFIERLVEVAESNDRVGAVGGKIFYYNKPNTIAFAGGRIDEIRGNAYHFTDDRFRRPSPVTFLTGCSLLIKAEVFGQVGLLDEYYFLYVEDLDFCFRVQKHGYSLVYVPDSIIYHKEGSSTGRLSPLSLYYSSRNRPYFVHKNVEKHFKVILFWIFYLPTRLLRSIQYGKKGRYIIKGIVDFIVFKVNSSCLLKKS